MTDTAVPEPLVSVIIPVYNAAKYLRETLDCICNQTLRNIEIICVDDGSTDDSPAILQEYAARDERFRILQQKNQYAGVARNNGMAAAKGKYLSFLDADDLFEPDMLEKMSARAEETGADLVHCQADEFCEKTGKQHMLYLVGQELLSTAEDVVCARTQFGDKLFQQMSTFAWNKLFLASFLKVNNLKWQDSPYINDVAFVRSAQFCSEKMAVVLDYLVHYRVRQDSISHCRKRNPKVYLGAYEELRSRLDNFHAGEETMRSFANVFWENIVYWFIPSLHAESLESLRFLYPEFDAQKMHLLSKPLTYFHNACIFETVQGFFRPSISFVVADTPAWCMERKLESLSGMPFYDYEILYATNPADTELMQQLEAQVAKNPRLRIVPCTAGNDAQVACRHTARGHILMPLPGNMKLRTGIAPALRQLAESQKQGDVNPSPYCTRQKRCELFYRSRSDRRSWCLFGKPLFTVFYTKTGQKQYFLMGKPIGSSGNSNAQS